MYVQDVCGSQIAIINSISSIYLLNLFNPNCWTGWIFSIFPSLLFQWILCTRFSSFFRLELAILLFHVFSFWWSLSSLNLVLSYFILLYFSLLVCFLSFHVSSSSVECTLDYFPRFYFNYQDLLEVHFISLSIFVFIRWFFKKT